MNNGVQLLLERMKTHPEEFSGLGKDGSKWYPLITSYRQHLAEDDMKALDAGVDAIMQQQFTEKVLEGLVDPKPSKSSEWADSVMQAKGIHSAGATLGQSWVKHQLAVAQTQSAVAQLQAHADYLEQQKQKMTSGQKTLYGRLKNYLHND